MKLDFTLAEDETAELPDAVATLREAGDIRVAAHLATLSEAKNHLRGYGLRDAVAGRGVFVHRLAQDGASGPLGHLGVLLGGIVERPALRTPLKSPPAASAPPDGAERDKGRFAELRGASTAILSDDANQSLGGEGPVS